MPLQNKKARLAHSQRPRGSIHFTNGLLADIEGLQIDPEYFPPDGDENNQPDSDDDTSEVMHGFSLVEDDYSGSEDEGSLEVDEDMGAEKSAQREEAAVCAAVDLAKEFWKRVLNRVCEYQHILVVIAYCCQYAEICCRASRDASQSPRNLLRSWHVYCISKESSLAKSLCRL
jgi:hypothetical protein